MRCESMECNCTDIKPASFTFIISLLMIRSNFMKTKPVVFIIKELYSYFSTVGTCRHRRMSSIKIFPLKFSLYAYFVGHCRLSELHVVSQAYHKQRIKQAQNETATVTNL